MDKTSSYLQGLYVRGVSGPHVEALHVRLKHSLEGHEAFKHITSKKHTKNTRITSKKKKKTQQVWHAALPSSEWTWWQCSAKRCTAPLCAEDQNENTLGVFVRQTFCRRKKVWRQPVAPQQPNKRLGDDTNFVFWRQVPVKLSNRHHDLNQSKQHIITRFYPSVWIKVLIKNKTKPWSHPSSDDPQ